MAAFALDAELRLEAISEALHSETWRPSPHRTFMISDPKPRLIAATPFADRVVHHAIHRVLLPAVSRRFSPHSFACLPGRGTHRAVSAFQEGLRRHSYVARLDIRRFFPEIRWDSALGCVAAWVDDGALLSLLERILDASAGLYARPMVLLGARGDGAAEPGSVPDYVPEPRKGLAIGDLTSQFFANAVLTGLDHSLQREQGAPGYLRYMDDLTIFSHSRVALRALVEDARAWLWTQRGLTTHPEGGEPESTRGTFRFLGYVVSRTERRVSARFRRRLLARLRAMVRAGVPPEAIRGHLASALGAVRF